MTTTALYSSAPDRIRLTGLSARGYHGVLPAEREDGQLFIVDAELRLGPAGTASAATADDLAASVDYSHVATVIVDLIEGEPVNLIETLAARIADAVLGFAGVREVEVTVHKPQAPIEVAFDDVAITITRSLEPAVSPVPPLPAPAAQTYPDPAAGVDAESAALAALAPVPAQLSAEQLVEDQAHEAAHLAEDPQASQVGATATAAPVLAAAGLGAAAATAAPLASVAVQAAVEGVDEGLDPLEVADVVGDVELSEDELAHAAHAEEVPAEVADTMAAYGEVSASTEASASEAALGVENNAELAEQSEPATAAEQVEPHAPESLHDAEAAAAEALYAVNPATEPAEQSASDAVPVEENADPVAVALAGADADLAAEAPAPVFDAPIAPAPETVPVAHLSIEEAIADLPNEAPIQSTLEAPAADFGADFSVPGLDAALLPINLNPARPAEAVIGLGGNVGEVVQALRTAVRTLQNTAGLTVTQVAPLARTAPVLPEGAAEQPDYLNTVVIVETTLAPRDLLGVLQDLEARAGRVRTTPKGPRTLDADLISYEGVTSDDPELILPHPGAAQRAFVLVPWLQVDPFAELGNESVSQLAEHAPDRDGVRWLALDWMDSDHLPSLPTGQYVAPPVAEMSDAEQSSSEAAAVVAASAEAAVAESAEPVAQAEPFAAAEPPAPAAPVQSAADGAFAPVPAPKAAQEAALLAPAQPGVVENRPEMAAPVQSAALAQPVAPAPAAPAQPVAPAPAPAPAEDLEWGAPPVWDDIVGPNN